MYIKKLCQFLLIFLITVQLSWCKCRTTYMTTCDSFKDFDTYHRDHENWEVLIIGSDNSTPNETVDLDCFPFYYKGPRLSALYVIKKIQKLKWNLYRRGCRTRHKLDLVVFSGNTFKRIDASFFSGTVIKKLSLTNNQIETIEPNVFREINALNFDLSDNFLEVLEKQTLPNGVKILTIKNNRLTYIEEGCFPSELESLKLDHNNLIQSLNPAIANLENLKILTLSHNKLRQLPQISHMIHLRQFDISHNAIRSIDGTVFQKLNTLEVIDLSYNHISFYNTLREMIGPKSHRLLKISLAFNNLTSLELENVTFKAERLMLYGNPWDCKKYDEMLKKLIRHQDECDWKLFYSGMLPYCVARSYLPHEYLEEREKIIQFYNIVQTEKTLIDCDLKFPDVIIKESDVSCVS